MYAQQTGSRKCMRSRPEVGNVCTVDRKQEMYAQQTGSRKCMHSRQEVGNVCTVDRKQEMYAQQTGCRKCMHSRQDVGSVCTVDRMQEMYAQQTGSRKCLHSRPEVGNAICNEHVYNIISYCLQLNDLNTITIMDLCDIGKIITGSIEGKLIVSKITALSHGASD